MADKRGKEVRAIDAKEEGGEREIQVVLGHPPPRKACPKLRYVLFVSREMDYMQMCVYIPKTRASAANIQVYV